jgi:hypothetical protein
MQLNHHHGGKKRLLESYLLLMEREQGDSSVLPFASRLWIYLVSGKYFDILADSIVAPE